jgi:Fe-S cluster biosynthesis and repair protein YggX
MPHDASAFDDAKVGPLRKPAGPQPGEDWRARLRGFVRFESIGSALISAIAHMLLFLALALVGWGIAGSEGVIVNMSIGEPDLSTAAEEESIEIPLPKQEDPPPQEAAAAPEQKPLEPQPPQPEPPKQTATEKPEPRKSEPKPSGGAAGKKSSRSGKLDQFGNPAGEGYGLGRSGEFSGQRILAYSGDGQIQTNIFTSDNPLWEALRKKGFKVDIRTGVFRGAWLATADQFWLFSGNRSSVDESGFQAIVSFVGKGKGLYVIADNEPWIAEATVLAQRLFGTQIRGNYTGNQIIAVRGQGATQNEARKYNAKQYVDPHALLTDIYYIYEGITISHIDPPSRNVLTPVLRASDGQVLAAVARDRRQRVVLDCGFTRYYYSPQGQFVTKTAGTLRYAENIAAYLAGKDGNGPRGQAGDDMWADENRGDSKAVSGPATARKKLLASYGRLDDAKLVAAMQHDDANHRWAAVSVAGRRPHLSGALIDRLRDADEQVRRLAHQTLVRLANGTDHGPKDGETGKELDAAVAAWSQWRQQQASGLLEDAKATHDKQKAAALLRLQQLVQWFPGTKAAEEASGLIEPWKADARNEQAREMLRLAEVVFESNPAAGKKRLQEVIDKFPGTPAAEQARQKLKRE